MRELQKNENFKVSELVNPLIIMLLILLNALQLSFMLLHGIFCLLKMWQCVY